MADAETGNIPARTLAVVGGGTMGLAIARLFAEANYKVRVFDERGVHLPQNLAAEATTSLAECVADVDVVFEAIVEDLDAKRLLLRDVQRLAGPVPVASNTSTYRPSQLAADLDFPEAVLVAHFFNPADVLPLVELVPSPVTAPTAVASVHAALLDAGKKVIILKHEIDGFIANRLQAALIREALWLLENGVASAEDIDATVVDGIGPRWALAGPFEVMDRGGLDVWEAVTGRLFPVLSTEDSTPAAISARVARGWLGQKSGRGFYNEYADSPTPFTRLPGVLTAAAKPTARHNTSSTNPAESRTDDAVFGTSDSPTS
jgi:3-hydroxybutyryl-CoA dehydrogenase